MKHYNKIITIIITILISLGLYSCSEESVDTFDGESAIYFRGRVSASTGSFLIGEDSTHYSFSLKPSSYLRDTVYITMRTMGKSFDVNRAISLIQVNTTEENAAIPNVHYLPFDSDEMKKLLIAKPGEVEPVIPIILLKSEDILTKEVRLVMQLVENDDFKLSLGRHSYVVRSTRQAVKPTLWDKYWKIYFGKTWGTVKMEFIVAATNFTDWEDYSLALRSYYGFLEGKVREAFERYNTNNPNNPLREYPKDGEELGELVTFN